ncbi:MAG: rRNA pseudouridine synthase [Oscillibacter sp.]|jgi:16S rRNA pseudouridine516 synthase|nr:rRNA pseudouridine synthase [Oscillibacter sp.]
MKAQRLDKLLASTGKWSRREAKLLIRQGRVLTDGVPAASAEAQLDPETAEIAVDGEPLRLRENTWVMLNKPAGVLSATEDGAGPTVLDLLAPELRRKGLFPVGRLDKDTEGLLLLTDDGALAHRLLSPRHHVDKVYRARVDGCLTGEDCAAFRRGMVLKDGLHCLPAELEILEAGAVSEARITLREGKFHQIKRMLAARGKPVLYLRREKMGNLPLDPELSSGAYRFLTDRELKTLQELEIPPKKDKT